MSVQPQPVAESSDSASAHVAEPARTLPPAWRHGLIAGAALAVLGIVLAVPAAFWPLQESTDLWLLFQLRPALTPPDDIVLATIDPWSAQRLSLPQNRKPPNLCADLRVGPVPSSHERVPPPHLVMRWPRCIHALAIDALAKAGARAIAVDISFRPLSVDSSNSCTRTAQLQDETLASAISTAGNVLVAQWMDPIGLVRAPLPGEAMASPPLHRPAPESSVIAEAALGAAPLRLTYGLAGRVNGFALFSEEETPLSSMPALVLQLNAAAAQSEFYRMLAQASPDTVDFIPKNTHELLANRPLQAHSLSIRHLLVNDLAASERLRSTVRSVQGEQSPQPLRSLVNVYTGPALRYLNFYGPAGTFKMVSYADLIAEGQRGGGLLFEQLRGKTVIIGYVDISTGQRDDHYSTVYNSEDGIKLSGAEILATAIANIQSDRNLVPPSELMRALVVAAFGLLLGPLLLVPAPQRGLFYAFVFCVLFVGSAVLLFRFADRWISLSIPLLAQAPIAILYTVSHGYREVLRKRDELRGLFGKFLPDTVIEGLVQNQGKLKTVADPFYGVCVVTDAERFTALAESMHPAKLADLLNCYFEVVFPRITERDGWIIDLIGDAVLAFWKGEDGHDPLHRKSCRATLELMAAVDRFNSESQNPLKTRIGIASGFVTTLPMGAFNHWEFRPVGDAVNTASRLQELNKMLGTRILISETLTSGTEGFLLRDVGTFQLRNKSESTHVFELVAEQASARTEQIHLCQEFGAALEEMRASQSDRALVRLRKLLQLYPDDGPTAFYVQWLSRHRHWTSAPIPQITPARNQPRRNGAGSTT